MVALAGDWHGDKRWAGGRILAAGARCARTLLHVGDFGAPWPGPSGTGYLMSIDAACRRAGVDEILVTPGNHEDWSELNRLWAKPDNRDAATGEALPLPLSEHVTVLPRGYAWTLGGRRFVSLGGAPSMDYPDRVEGESWWSEERIEAEDVERTIANGAGADVMLAHDSPDDPWWTPAVEAIVRTGAGASWTEEALGHAAVGRQRMSTALLGVTPRLFAHGHYHVACETTVQLPGADHETRIWSLDAEHASGNLRFLDLSTLSSPEWS